MCPYRPNRWYTSAMVLLCGMYLTNSFTCVASGSGDFLRRPVGGNEVPFRDTWLIEWIPFGWASPGGGAVLDEEEEESAEPEANFF